VALAERVRKILGTRLMVPITPSAAGRSRVASGGRDSTEHRSFKLRADFRPMTLGNRGASVIGVGTLEAFNQRTAAIPALPTRAFEGQRHIATSRVSPALSDYENLGSTTVEQFVFA
jgi:hypothetical protein